MLLEEYRKVFREQSLVQAPRFIVFEPIDRTGWGNRLRGMTLCILMAIATKRILVVRDFLLEEHLMSPEGCSWRYRDWKQRILAGADETSLMDLHMATDKFDAVEWESFGVESMETLFPARILLLQESIGFFDRLMVNPLYTDLWTRLGLKTDNKISWIGAISEAFLNRPTVRLERAVSRLKRRVGIADLQNSWLVQFRTFFDIGSPNLRALDAFMDGIESQLREDGGVPSAFYVTTDDKAATAVIAGRLSKVALVVGSPVRMVHTGNLHVGLESLVERGLRKLFGREFYFFDWWSWLPEGVRPRPHTAVLAEWYLMGEFGTAASTFTSFAVYALARKGNRARLLRFDPTSGLLGPLENRHYGF